MFKKFDVGAFLKLLLDLMCIYLLPEIDLLLCERADHHILWSAKFLLRARYIAVALAIQSSDQRSDIS
jgi:hypothetical protein